MKNKINIAAIIILSLIAFVACVDKTDTYEFPVDEYVYDIPDVPVTEDYIIGVPYDVKRVDSTTLEWWDSSKKAHLLYTGTPELGEYDMKLQPEVLLKHLDWGKEAGIDFFIISWGGHGYNDTLFREYEKYYKPGHPQLVIRFDPGYRFGASADTLQLNHKNYLDSMKFDFDSLYHHVMVKDYAFKHKQHNVPVMVLCNYRQENKVLHISPFTDIFRDIAGDKLWMMGEMDGQWTSPERWGYRDESTQGVVMGDTIAAFDALFITQIYTGNYDRYLNFYSFMDYNYNYWKEKMTIREREYIPSISPAYDNMVNNLNTFDNYLIPRWKEKNGGYAYAISDSVNGVTNNWTAIKENPYKTLANVAKRNVGPSRMVIIYHWNDFTSGRSLEPTKEYGNDYLRYTKQFFKK